MKMTIRRLLFSGFISLYLSPISTSAETIRFATIDYCPFTCNPSEEDGREGIMTDVLREAFEKAGYQIEISTLPYVRAVRYVNDGRYDGIVLVGKKYAPELVYPDHSTLKQRVVFLANMGTSWSYSGVTSLKNVRLGIVRGFHYVDDDLVGYLEREKNNSARMYVIHGDKTTERAIGMLRSYRITAFIEGEYSVLYELKKKGISNALRIAGYTSEAFEGFTAFSPRSPKSKKYARILSNTLEELKRSGRLSNILRRYGIKPHSHMD
jgi:polar amino acid transport system substrate-binding protein